MIELLTCEPGSTIFWIGFGGIALPGLTSVIWWLVRRAGKREAATGETPPLPAAQLEGPVAQLEGIEGIGPQIAERLRASGVDTFEELAQARPDSLRQILRQSSPGLPMVDPASWPLQARLIASGDFEGFRMLAVRLRGGSPRLEDIDGIGDTIAAELRASGIASIAALLAAAPDSVHAATSGRFDNGIVAGWLRQAQMLHAGDEAALLALAGLEGRTLRDLPRPSLIRRAVSAGSRVPTAEIASLLFGERSFPHWLPLKTILPAGLAVMLAAVLYMAAGAGGLLPPAMAQSCPGPRPDETDPPVPEPTPHCECPAQDVGGQVFPADTLFQPGSTALSAEGKAAISTLARTLSGRLAAPDRTDVIAIVIGHADATAFNRPGGNDALSLARAMAVRAELETQPLFSGAEFVTIGRGASEPSGATTRCAQLPSPAERFACYAPDRRVAVRVMYLPRTQETEQPTP